jgi:cob(I)alamin adenosyltransferase
MPRKGLIIVHTGNGKGKTTAALGTAFRALGYGWRVLMVQFIKGNWHYGELDAAKRFEGLIEIRPMGEGFTWDTKNPERDRQKAHEAWEFGKNEALSGKWDLVTEMREIKHPFKKGIKAQKGIEF